MKIRRMVKPMQRVPIAVVAMAMTAPLYAAPAIRAPDARNPAFQRMDATHDGYVSGDEAVKLRSFDKG